MKISKQWIKDFVDISKISPDDIAKRLTLSTVEVEGIHVLGEHLSDVVVGAVLSVGRHPNADKLNVCTVDVGKKQLDMADYQKFT